MYWKELQQCKYVHLSKLTVLPLKICVLYYIQILPQKKKEPYTNTDFYLMRYVLKYLGVKLLMSAILKSIRKIRQIDGLIEELIDGYLCIIKQVHIDIGMRTWQLFCIILFSEYSYEISCIITIIIIYWCSYFMVANFPRVKIILRLYCTLKYRILSTKLIFQLKKSSWILQFVVTS